MRAAVGEKSVTLLLVWMSTADVQDRDAAQAVLPLAAHDYPTLQKMWADGAYH